MHAHGSVLAGVALAVVSFAAPGPASAQEKVLLKENVVAGETYTIASFREMSLTFAGTINGQAFEQRQMNREEAFLGERILEVEGGSPRRLRRYYAKHRVTSSDSHTNRQETKDGPHAGRVFVLSGLGASRTADCLNDTLGPTEDRPKPGPFGRLLPGREVAVGESWEPPAHVLSWLFFDDTDETVESATMKCTLTGVEERGGMRYARIAVELSTAREQGSGSNFRMNLRGTAIFRLADGAFQEWELLGTAMMRSVAKDPSGREYRMNGEGPVVMREAREYGKADLGDEQRPPARPERPGR
ncbi:MAG: hypothetical protein HYZ53_01475 [Planctomycetes bacterium]|nr:hypothetical protein [Planctomycetota bacterium]